jgi:hypothetical protein
MLEAYHNQALTLRQREVVDVLVKLGAGKGPDEPICDQLTLDILQLVDGAWIRLPDDGTCYEAAANAEAPLAKHDGLFRVQFNLLWLDGRKVVLTPYEYPTCS